MKWEKIILPILGLILFVLFILSISTFFMWLSPILENFLEILKDALYVNENKYSILMDILKRTLSWVNQFIC